MLASTPIQPLSSRGGGTLSRVALLAVTCLVGLALLASDAFGAQLPVRLGASDGFAVLAGQTVTNAGFSTLNGDLGVSPGSALTGFPPGTVNGTIHATDPVASQAQADLRTAYDDAAGRTPSIALPADVGGRTLAPGVHKSAAALGLTGTLTLDGQGDRNAVFVFQVGSALTTAVGSHVNLINGAQPCNVFWQIGSSATLGTSSVFAGNILALTSIAMRYGVTLNGRALARNGSVTLINDTVTAARCARGPRPGASATKSSTARRCRPRRSSNTRAQARKRGDGSLSRAGGEARAAQANGADADGDALPDSWEKKGLDTNGDGRIDLDLRKMGASSRHKDLFVELDAMCGHAIRNAAVTRVVAAFRRAPVSNPDGKPGIRLHVDNGPRSVMNPVTGRRWGRRSESEQRLSHRKSLRLFKGFDAIKAKHFSRKRRRVFRYGVSIHQIAGTLSSGRARGIPASDFVVSLGRGSGSKDINAGGTAAQTGTLMHEFGHTIGLRHGGGNGVNSKPNFLSVMNYDWQFPGLFRADGRQGLYDYSRYGAQSPAGTLAALNETSLVEPEGLRATGGATGLQAARHCGKRLLLMPLNAPVDWNCNGGVDAQAPVRADINNDGPEQALDPYDDWANLRYAGGSVGVAAAVAARSQSATAAAEPAPTEPSAEPAPTEPSVEELQAIAQQLTGDFTPPTIRIRGKRRVRMPRVARLVVVARDNKQVTDLEVVVDGRARYVTSLDKSRGKLVLRLRFRRGRHRIVAHAVDGATTSSRVARATVVVR